MIEKAYDDLKKFWDNNFKITEDDKIAIKKELSNTNYLSLAPSLKQVKTLKLFKGAKNVLDYGCGTGWASIIMALNGTSKIKAVDVSKNSLEILKCYMEAFNIKDSIEPLAIDKDWLKKEESIKYDGFFSSNVIDVIPLEMSKDIIKESARVLKKGSLAVFSLNYYVNPEDMKTKNTIVLGPHIFMEGVLRLTSLTDDEWLEIFSLYYELVRIVYYSWEGETKESRRLFILKRK